MDSAAVYSLATLVAILVGPIMAVVVTRKLDAQAETRRRKFELFKDLMQTRGIRLDPIHVAALNIVELEFYDHPKVRAEFKKYIEHLSSPAPNGNQDDLNRYYDQRSDQFMELIYEIGIVLGYKFDKRELDRRSYVPKGWNDDQFMQRKNASMINQLLEGQRALPITNLLSRQNPFPEAPQDLDE